MNICEHLSNQARVFPHQRAIVWESFAFTYEQLNAQSVAAADYLRRCGVGAGDRVALMLPNIPAFAVWYFGALRVGAIVVSLSTRLAEAEIAFVADDCTPTVLIVPSESVEIKTPLKSVDHVLKTDDLGILCNGQKLLTEVISNRSIYEAAPEEPALILYTSGTTGFPKGATLSHGNVRSNVCAFNHLCEMSHQDVILLTVPLFHCFGQNALLNSGLNAGATLVLQRKFDPQESKRLIVEHNVTQLYGVPTMFQMLNDCCSVDDLSSVSYCFTAASTMPIQVADRWQKTYKMPICEGYGLTETSPFASYNHRLQFVPGSIGTPIDNVEMKIVDSATKAPCGPGELGEIAIRGPNVMLGYWNRPEETAAAIVDRWFYSGDIGRVDEAGYFFIVDRVKDMISIGGLKVYPAEVERVLLDHESVKQAAVVGFANVLLGEEVAAFVVKQESAGPSVVGDLKNHCRQHLANYKMPKHIFLVEQLPRNPSGKVLKTELRARQSALLGKSQNNQQTQHVDDLRIGEPNSVSVIDNRLVQQLRSVYATQRSQVACEYLQSVVMEITGDEAYPGVGDQLLEAGLDSLMVVELSHRLQVELGDTTDVSATVIFDYPTIGELADFVISRLFPNEAVGDAARSALSGGGSIGGSDSLDAGGDRLKEQVARMSQDQVLEELLKELDDQ